MVSCKVELNLKREREKLISKKHPNTVAVKEKAKAFSLKIQNKFSILGDETYYDLKETNDQLTKIVMEAAMEVGGKAPRNRGSKLSQETKDFIKKRKDMREKTRRDEKELAELTKLINSKKVRDIRNFNMEQIKETLKKGKSVKTTERRLGVGRHQLFALKDANGNVTSNMEEVLRVAEEFYTELYSDQERQEEEEHDSLNLEVPVVTVDEVRIALKGMSWGKAGGRRWPNCRPNQRCK